MQELNEKQIECVAGGDGVWLREWLCVCNSGYPHIVLPDESKGFCGYFCCIKHGETGGMVSKIVYFKFPVHDIDPDTTETFSCSKVSKVCSITTAAKTNVLAGVATAATGAW